MRTKPKKSSAEQGRILIWHNDGDKTTSIQTKAKCGKHRYLRLEIHRSEVFQVEKRMNHRHLHSKSQTDT